ncbi:hypothetical protein AMK68_03690 [candidate division KD3-62 bacterium DG_56]|uniref:Uncharacterized protein n=1 Tax=candidate division KD3-62 bacterium DG_56 TaxID=1704032 RepID=A0A0S7XMF7_9BACT|nr:MAG: hypothetical protein AMK68_03690 [candidate division KD3-62 bacterium DG_56]
MSELRLLLCATMLTIPLFADTVVSGKQAARKAYTYRPVVGGVEYDDLILLLTLQGIVNRTGPRLFYDTEGRSDWGPADRRWVRIYRDRKGFTFQQIDSLDRLIDTFRSRLRGAVVYDPGLDATRYVAITVGALNNWLPVTPAQRKGRLGDLPVRADLRGRWQTSREVYRWAIKELLPRCHRRLAYNAGKSHDDVNMGWDPAVIMALDYAVARRGFVFNLSPAARPTSYDNDTQLVAGYPDDAALMDTILKALDRPAQIYGWAEPEWTFVQRLSRRGHVLVCGHAGNLSFHARVPCRKRRFRQPRHGRTAIAQPEDKYYLAFMTNEGDTPRVLATFFFGAWLDAHRGEIPINWGVSPALLAEFPALAEYYYETATENDYFYAGVSGSGYAFIDRLPNVGQLAEFGRPFFRNADIDVVDSWDYTKFRPDRYDEYARTAGVKLFTLLPRGPSRIEMLPCGVPAIVPDGRVHYKIDDVDQVVRAIEAIAKENPPPFLIPLYGGLGHQAIQRYRKIARGLDPERFEFVGLDDLRPLATKMGS